jgi:hypothetical protein
MLKNFIRLHRFIFQTILLSLLFNSLHGQQWSSLRTQTFSISATEVKLDSLLIVPGSLRIADKSGQYIADSCFWVNYETNIVHFSNVIPFPIHILYRVFPFDFRKSYPLHSDSIPFLSDIHSRENKPQPSAKKTITSDALFDSPGLSKSGSISRSISIGNSQDVIVNSSLNLQLNGQIKDNLYLSAVITDNNIPIQPDGYSQQIREFDKVYIKIYNDKHSLQAGDLDLEKPQGYFMVMNRKVQGALYQGQFKIGKNNETTYTTQISAASAKGKYSRNTFQGTEGSQGPYKLTGAQNETYIVLLAGSEKVYIDGRKLTRGQDNDYTIDYNAGEITFTTKQPITKDSRIVVEFEYSDKSYARYTLFQTNRFETKKSSFWLNYFSENDIKSQPLDQTLNDAEKKFLSQIGDNTSTALYPKADSVAYSKTSILYAKADTIINGITYSYYRFSTNSDSAHYQLSFTKKGTNKGNYTQYLTLANGTVYRWVAPVSGVSQGEYEPLALLVAPQKKQVITLGGKTKLNDNTSVGAEMAFSDNDKNTFSNLDDGNNKGVALHITANRNIRFSDSSWTAYANLVTGYVQKNFDAVDRFRPVEYERDWNLGSISQTGTDELNLSTTFGFKRISRASGNYSFEFLRRGITYDGKRLSAENRYSDAHNLITLTGSFLASADSTNRTRFLRLNGSYTRTIGPLNIGFRHDEEQNLWRSRTVDTLLSSSYSYYKNQWFIQSRDTLRHNASLSYAVRDDYQPFSGKLLHYTRAQEYAAKAQLLKQKRQSASISLSYRKLDLIRQIDTITKPEGTLLARLDHSLRSSDNLYSSTSYLELGSGMENKKEYSYVEVTTGQGSYKWVDYNKNGLQELNEFELCTFTDEANYVRVFIPTTQYLKVYTSSLSHNFNLNPARKWKDTTGWKSVISRFFNQFSFVLSNHNTSSSFFKQNNPFHPFFSAGDITSLNLQLRNTLSFQSANNEWATDYQYLNSRTRSLLVNGLDNQQQYTHGLHLRWQPFVQFRSTLNTSFGQKSYASGYMSSRDYNLRLFTSETGTNWQTGENGSIGITCAFNYKMNIPGSESSKELNFGTTYDYSAARKGNFRTTANYIHIKFIGESATSVGYEMLQGLQPGSNFTWSLNYLKSLQNGLEIKLTYNGRSTGGGSPVHTATIEIRANF